MSPLDGTMHLASQAYSPSGALQWSFTFPVTTGTISAPDVATDGTHYVVNRTFELYALAPNGSEQWHIALPNPVSAPNVDPTQSLVVLGSDGTLDMPGFVQAIASSSRMEAWRLVVGPLTQSGFTVAIAPNPSRDGTTLRFQLRSAETVHVCIYDVAGRVVRDFGGVRMSAGPQSIRWDGKNSRGEAAPAGLFLVRVNAGEREQVAKLLRVR